MATLRGAYEIRLTEYRKEIESLKEINAELLSALEVLRSWCIPGMDWTDETGQAVLADATAAIAKARGEQP